MKYSNLPNSERSGQSEFGEDVSTSARVYDQKEHPKNKRMYLENGD